MIFQSKYRGHMIVMRSATYEQVPGLQRSKLVPQLVAKFEGPQRLFNSRAVQAAENWSEEDHDAMVDWLFNHPLYMVEFFVAPGEKIPDEYAKLSERKAPPKPLICERFEIIDNDIIRCPNPVTAGRSYCKEHDDSEQKHIVGAGGSGETGLPTTKG